MFLNISFHVSYIQCECVLSQQCPLPVNINDSRVTATTCSSLQESLSNRKIIHGHLRATGGLYFSQSLLFGLSVTYIHIVTRKIHVFTQALCVHLIHAFSFLLFFLQRERGITAQNVETAVHQRKSPSGEFNACMHI